VNRTEGSRFVFREKVPDPFLHRFVFREKVPDPFLHNVDKVLRLFVVTPDMHRVHHSIEVKETNSNFGFNLSFWDKLFKTYKAQPEKGHQNMIIGLKTLRDDKTCSRIDKMLSIPFLKK